MKGFIQGLTLSRLFYEEIVGPLWRKYFSHIPYSAAIIGPGSEVLGFDTSQSTDHHWGPRLMIFLREEDFRQYRDDVHGLFREHLPHSFKGFSTNFGHPDAVGVRLLREIDSGPVNHRIELLTFEGFFSDYLGINPLGEISVMDWLTLPEQCLLSVAGGAVYHDGIGGTLQKIRQKLNYYPDDVWRYLLASQWQRISQEEAFVGRCGDVEDELGSRLIAARLIRDLMKLCFLMERCYAPYNKWFGTAFARLNCAQKLLPVFDKVLQAKSWRGRESRLSTAYEVVANMHNALGITEVMNPRVSPYYGRPYLVIHAERFVEALRATIQNDELRNMNESIGSVDRFTDCTDIVSNPKLFRRLSVMY